MQKKNNIADMNYEEKLDFILKTLYEKNAFYMYETSVYDYLKPHVSQNEFQEFKLRLITDGYLKQDTDEKSSGAYQASFTNRTSTYSITSKGEHSVKSGEGYVSRKNEEKLILNITKNSYRINKWVLALTILSIVLAIIALLK